jgi:2-methylisocitrate lyase-like PEP mutase family enzyme
MTMAASAGQRLRQALELAADQQQILPFVGIYDLFSASLAADRFESLFLSGFGLAASAYGLPDIGFIGWGDLTTTTNRLRALLPSHHLLVDFDDGFGDATVASHVARTLERCGASGVVLEDQARPRRCGHLGGKQLLPLPDYLKKLEAVLADRSSLVVVARTDASDPQEILTRVQAFEQAGCDAVLADGIKDLELIAQIRAAVACPVFSNVIGGGKVPPCSRADLAGQGVQGLIYSTPCLFAAQGAIEQVLDDLSDAEGDLSGALASARQLSHCNAVLHTNLQRAGEA